MFHYKVIENEQIVGYVESDLERNISNFLPIDEEEYNAAIIQMQEEEQKRQKQQAIVEEQADLLNKRTAADLTKAQRAYIEARLEEIDEYWDSLEGEVTTYGTDN